VLLYLYSLLLWHPFAHLCREWSIQNVIVLIRDPAHAIPSWYNQIYESFIHAEFHSQQKGGVLFHTLAKHQLR
jgi:hypothetical protein